MSTDDMPACQPQTVSRFVRWARRVQSDIIAALGSQCWRCGRRYALELDHIDPRTKSPDFRKSGYVRRTTLYRRDFAAGYLQCLCRPCNKRKGQSCKHYTPPLLP